MDVEEIIVENDDWETNGDLEALKEFAAEAGFSIFIGEQGCGLFGSSLILDCTPFSWNPIVSRRKVSLRYSMA